MPFKTIEPKEVPGSVFETFDKEWMLLAAGTPEKNNAMTISWGGLGILWRKAVSYVFVRHSRYTFQFVEKSPYYSLSLFGGEYMKELGMLGAVSGRDKDKIAESGLTLAYDENGVPYFEEAKYVFICKKMYSDDMTPAQFIDPSLNELYKDHDYHRMYVGEILTVLKREE